MEMKGGNFDICVQLREVGFPQLRKFQAMYYVRADTLVCIDDLSVLKNDGHTDFENVFGGLVFKPSLEDIADQSETFFHELIRMGDSTFMAYSNVAEDEEYLKSTGRQDPWIRAPGATEWRARANLYVLVRNVERRATLSPEELDASENKFEHSGTEDPTVANYKQPDM